MLDPFRRPARGGPIALALSAAIAVLGPLPSIAQSGAPITVQAGAPGDADPGPLILHILDYVAADYPGAVKAGKVLDEGEYKEQVEFTTQARPFGSTAMRTAAPGFCCRVVPSHS